MSEKLRVKIGVEGEGEGDRLRVVAESVWKNDKFHDLSGVLEGMLDEVYDDEYEIRDAVSQIFNDEGIESKFDLELYYIP